MKVRQVCIYKFKMNEGKKGMYISLRMNEGKVRYVYISLRMNVCKKGMYISLRMNEGKVRYVYISFKKKEGSQGK